jgi:hypothetical protein
MALTAELPRVRARTASPWIVRVTAVSCLFGSEAIHTAVIGEHIAEWLPFGLFFLVISLVEGLLAVILITAPSPAVQRLAVAISLGTVALWLFSRTAGLPIGPMAGAAEPIGRADTVASVLELVTAVALLAPVTLTASARRSARDYVVAAFILSIVLALTLLAHT